MAPPKDINNSPTLSLIPVTPDEHGYLGSAGESITACLQKLLSNIRPSLQSSFTVLIKPNWVVHKNKAGAGTECLYTQPDVILSALKTVAEISPSRIIIGDSPLQGCDLAHILTPDIKASLTSAAPAIDVEITDFRRYIVSKGNLVSGVEETGRKASDYILFDLGTHSLLEPITDETPRFRVTKYDPRQLARSHYPGKHQYLICREAIEADIVLSLPKLKTHSKAGVTCVLKNLVGINGNKDFLPHHRVGGSFEGGDCYKGFDPLRRMAEYCLDRANMHIGTATYTTWARRCAKIMRLQRRLGRPVNIEGGWYGNDTCWRMVLDLNRILIYGRLDGTLADTPQRKIISVVDAVMAGQGEGPLAPSPLPLNCLLVSDDSACCDWLGAVLLGMNPQQIPLTNHAFDRFPYPITTTQPENIRVDCFGQSLSVSELSSRYAHVAELPVGWKNYRHRTLC